MTEQDLLAVLFQLGGRSFAPELTHWVHSTKELPVTALLEKHGIQVHLEPDLVAQQLGLRVKESNGLFIQNVLRGGAAERAGFASGDEWIAVQPAGKGTDGPWRLQTLDDFTLYAGNAKAVTAIISRDKRLLPLTLALPKPGHSVRLTVRDETLANAWLGKPPASA
jgi:predicted metalloprotease with PDZ domain